MGKKNWLVCCLIVSAAFLCQLMFVNVASADPITTFCNLNQPGQVCNVTVRNNLPYKQLVCNNDSNQNIDVNFQPNCAITFQELRAGEQRIYTHYCTQGGNNTLSRVPIAAVPVRCNYTQSSQPL